MKGPAARREHLLVREVDADLVIYDPRSHRAHSLDPSARRLWSWCDGATPPAEMARRLAGSREEVAEAELVVHETLLRLDAADLLETNGYQLAPPDVYSRRRCLGALVTLPVIVSILVPTAADAQSMVPPGGSCTSSSQCTTGCCNSASNRCTAGGDAICL